MQITRLPLPHSLYKLLEPQSLFTSLDNLFRLLQPNVQFPIVFFRRSYFIPCTVSMVEYQPLLGPQIRLLTIQPGEPEDDIQCSLTTVSLDDQPKYEALSYVWGDPTDTRNIFVQVFAKSDKISKAFRGLHLRGWPRRGAALPVSQNLFKALRCFRRRDKRRTIWVDAVCINQQDLAERSSQVLLMGRIYRQCEVCQIWLGDADDVPLAPDPNFSSTKWHDGKNLNHYSVPGYATMELRIKEENIRRVKPIDNFDLKRNGNLLSISGAFALLKLLGKTGTDGTHFHTLPFYKITDFPHFELCEQWHNARRSLVNICSREWWQRTWTLQEAILPQQAIVNVGSHQAELYQFEWARKNVILYTAEFHGCCKGIPLWEREPAYGIHLGAALERAESLSILRESWQYTGKGTLKYHRSESSSRRVTDPRDAVYGYLGLIPELLPPGQNPDYAGETVASLYAKTTKRHIAWYSSLEILKYVMPLQVRSDGVLPSWTVDWQDNRNVFPNWSDLIACGQFTDYERADILFDEPQVLPLDVLVVGTVSWVSSPTRINKFYAKTRAVVQRFETWQEAAGGVLATKVTEKTKKHLDDEEGEAEKNRGRARRFWRTVFLGSRVITSDGPDPVEGRFGFRERDLDHLTAWWAWFRRTTKVSRSRIWTRGYEYYPRPEYKECWEKLQERIEDMVFCVLEVPGRTERRISMCLRCVMPGDIVVVAKGSSWPLVLRKIDGEVPRADPLRPAPSPPSLDAVDLQHDSSSSWESLSLEETPSLSASYKFLGCAYVDGIMKGEAVSKEPKWNLVHVV